MDWSFLYRWILSFFSILFGWIFACLPRSSSGKPKPAQNPPRSRQQSFKYKDSQSQSRRQSGSGTSAGIGASGEGNGDGDDDRNRRPEKPVDAFKVFLDVFARISERKMFLMLISLMAMAGYITFDMTGPELINVFDQVPGNLPFLRNALGHQTARNVVAHLLPSSNPPDRNTDYATMRSDLIKWERNQSLGPAVQRFCEQHKGRVLNEMKNILNKINSNGSRLSVQLTKAVQACECSDTSNSYEQDWGRGSMLDFWAGNAPAAPAALGGAVPALGGPAPLVPAQAAPAAPDAPAALGGALVPAPAAGRGHVNRRFGIRPRDSNDDPVSSGDGAVPESTGKRGRSGRSGRPATSGRHATARDSEVDIRGELLPTTRNFSRVIRTGTLQVDISDSLRTPTGHRYFVANAPGRTRFIADDYLQRIAVLDFRAHDYVRGSALLNMREFYESFVREQDRMPSLEASSWIHYNLPRIIVPDSPGIPAYVIIAIFQDSVVFFHRINREDAPGGPFFRSSSLLDTISLGQCLMDHAGCSVSSPCTACHYEGCIICLDRAPASGMAAICSDCRDKFRKAFGGIGYCNGCYRLLGKDCTVWIFPLAQFRNAFEALCSICCRDLNRPSSHAFSLDEWIQYQERITNSVPPNQIRLASRHARRFGWVLANDVLNDSPGPLSITANQTGSVPISEKDKSDRFFGIFNRKIREHTLHLVKAITGRQPEPAPAVSGVHGNGSHGGQGSQIAPAVAGGHGNGSHGGQGSQIAPAVAGGHGADGGSDPAPVPAVPSRPGPASAPVPAVSSRPGPASAPNGSQTAPADGGVQGSGGHGPGSGSQPPPASADGMGGSSGDGSGGQVGSGSGGQVGGGSQGDGNSGSGGGSGSGGISGSDDTDDLDMLQKEEDRLLGELARLDVELRNLHSKNLDLDTAAERLTNELGEDTVLEDFQRRMQEFQVNIELNLAEQDKITTSIRDLNIQLRDVKIKLARKKREKAVRRASQLQDIKNVKVFRQKLQAISEAFNSFVRPLLEGNVSDFSHVQQFRDNHPDLQTEISQAVAGLDWDALIAAIPNPAASAGAAGGARAVRSPTDGARDGPGGGGGAGDGDGGGGAAAGSSGT